MTAEHGRRDPEVGLCADCAHAVTVPTARGSTFWLCSLSASDPRFRKYPALPVLQCDGYEGTAGSG